MARYTYRFDKDVGDFVEISVWNERQKKKAADRQPMHPDFLPKKAERGSWVYDKSRGMVVSRYEAPPKQKSAVVISDDMPATQHMADGKTYESKSMFRKVTRDHGCVEVGNDKITPDRSHDRSENKKRVREAIEKTFYQLTGDPLARTINSDKAREQLARMGRT